MAEQSKKIYRVLIRAKIEDVWREITKTDTPIACFFNSMLDTTGLAPGAPIRMRTRSGKYTGIVGEVLEFDPPRKYSHTFKFTNLDDPPCKVSYELKEVEDGVEFTLTTEDVPEGTKTEKYMSQGGDFIVKTLKGVLENGRPPFSSRMILLICKLTEFMTPKRSRSENWPL